MWIVDVGKKELALVLSGESAARESIAATGREAGTSILSYQDGLSVLWRDGAAAGGERPSAVLVSETEMRDLLAWSATYLPAFRPLSAFFRVSDARTAGIVLDAQQRGVPPRWANALLGMILAEGQRSRPDRESVESSFRACVQSCSFALTRAAAAGFLSQLCESIVEQWARVHRVAAATELVEPWLVVADVFDQAATRGRDERTENIQRICEGIANDQPAVKHWLFPGLLSAVGIESHFVVDLSDPETSRETRVKLTEQILATLLAKKDGRATVETPFLAGYAVSRIAPGTLEHMQMLDPLGSRLPQARLWYGLLAGLEKTSNLTRLGSGFATRIQRDAFRIESFWAAPTADLNVAEWAMLSTGGTGPSMPSRLSLSGQVEIELVPTVSTILTSAKPMATANDVDQFETQRIVKEMRHAIAHADSLQRRLERATRTGDAPAESGSQRTFFKPQRSSRKKY